MLTDIKQVELDAFEKAVMRGIFGQETLPAWADLAFSFKGIDPQKYINRFEEVMRPFLKDNGLVNAESIKKLVAMKDPKWAALIPNEDFRLVDSAENVISLISNLFNNFLKG